MHRRAYCPARQGNFLESPHHYASSTSIKPASGLVEENNRRIRNEFDSYRKALPLLGGQSGLREVAPNQFVLDQDQIQHPEGALHELLGALWRHVGVVRVETESRGELDGFQYAQLGGLQVELLHIAGATSERIGRLRVAVEIHHPLHLAARLSEGQDVHQRRLARPRRSHEGGHLSGLDAAAHPLQQLDRFLRDGGFGRIVDILKCQIDLLEGEKVEPVVVPGLSVAVAVAPVVGLVVLLAATFLLRRGAHLGVDVDVI
mmetsp:Transcript_29365/g.87024  ORF Transcript_29365/g.87024 Transcript_29365/m.87024 type:complete len:260 (+) Transcript_29365:1265-2044(+)